MPRHLPILAGAALVLALLASAFPTVGGETKKKKKTDKKDPEPTAVEEFVPKTEAEKKAVKSAQDVEAIDTAFRLAQIGRDSKDPLLLLSAAKVLRRFKAAEPNFQVDPDAKEAVKFEAGSFTAESDKLLKEAAAVSKSNLEEKLKDPDVSEGAKKTLTTDDAQIAELAERIGKGTRGLTTGPSLGVHPIGPRGTHSFNLTYIPYAPAVLTLQGQPGMRFRMAIRGSKGALHYQDEGQVCRITFQPTWQGVTRVTVTNLTNQPGVFQVVGN